MRGLTAGGGGVYGREGVAEVEWCGVLLCLPILESSISNFFEVCIHSLSSWSCSLIRLFFLFNFFLVLLPVFSSGNLRVQRGEEDGVGTDSLLYC